MNDEEPTISFRAALVFALAVALFLILLLSGCALASPQRHVASLERGPKFETPECAQARKEAEDYSDRVAERIAENGVFNLFGAIKSDLDQADKRNAVKAKVDRACT